MRTANGWYPIQPSTLCRPEDHGWLNDHVVSIEDTEGRVLWNPFDQAVGAAYVSGGNAAMDAIAATAPMAMRLVARFDAGHPEAARWLQTHGAQRVTEIVADQREGVREALRAGMEAGRHPRNVALDIVGRVDKVAKRRTGGLIGLTSGQMGYVQNARAELADPDLMRNYLTRKRRDKRFDATVRKALLEDNP